MKEKLSWLLLVVFVMTICLTPIAFAEGPVVTNVVPGNVYIPRGTLIKVELVTPVNSGKNKVNDIVLFKTTESLIINGTEVIPKGTTGDAIVTKVKKAGAWGKGGKIELTAKSIKTLNGVEIPLTLDIEQYGGGKGMVVPVLLIGVFSGFVHGKNIDMPVGTKFQVAVDGDTDLGVKPDKLEETISVYKTVNVSVQ